MTEYIESINNNLFNYNYDILFNISTLLTKFLVLVGKDGNQKVY